MTALPTPFDYAILDPAVADKARAAADRIRTLTRAAVQDVGRELLAIKKQVERGQFTAWVKHECGINIRTAQRAMNAAQLVAENDKLSYLPQDGLLALPRDQHRLPSDLSSSTRLSVVNALRSRRSKRRSPRTRPA